MHGNSSYLSQDTAMGCIATSEQSGALAGAKGSTAGGRLAGKWIITKMNTGFICLK